jgi:hypothetical protein
VLNCFEGVSTFKAASPLLNVHDIIGVAALQPPRHRPRAARGGRGRSAGGAAAAN